MRAARQQYKHNRAVQKRQPPSKRGAVAGWMGRKSEYKHTECLARSDAKSFAAASQKFRMIWNPFLLVLSISLSGSVIRPRRLSVLRPSTHHRHRNIARLGGFANCVGKNHRISTAVSCIHERTKTKRREHVFACPRLKNCPNLAAIDVGSSLSSRFSIAQT